MTNLDLNMVDSILKVTASGIDNETIIKDLHLPQGKSIAQLIYEQEITEKTENPEQTTK